jgi:tetratricopeptide (TPR) repeat protein
MKSKILLEGSIGEYSLEQILVFCNRSQKTGELILTSEDREKRVYFIHGVIVFASSSHESDRLGDILLSAGKISEEEYITSKKLSEESGKRKGIILIEEGYLKPQDLISAVNEQVKKIIVDLFEWEDGRFVFRESPPCEEVITLDVSLKEIIREGRLRRKSAEAGEVKFLKKNVAQLYDTIESMSHYERLDVPMDAPYDKIKKAFLEKVRYYHPDRHNHSFESSLNEKLSTILSLLNESHMTLKDEQSRATYDKSMFSTLKKSEPSSNVVSANESYLQGISFFKEGNYWNAADSFKRAIRFVPDRANYWAHLSLALSRMPRRSKDAEEAMLKAISLDSNNPDHYVQLGLIYQKANMKLRAIRQYETALSWDPYNSVALREIEKLKSKKKKSR